MTFRLALLSLTAPLLLIACGDASMHDHKNADGMHKSGHAASTNDMVDMQNDSSPARSLDGFNPAYDLTNHVGEGVSTQTYAGKYQVVFFGFTHCPDVCPIGLSTLTQSLDLLTSDEAAAIKPVLITVDPARDTVEALGYYVSAFHPNLVGLTGSQEKIDQVTQGFGVLAMKETTEDHDHYNVGHTSLFYVINPDGKAVGTFRSDVQPTEMVETLRFFMKA